MNLTIFFSLVPGVRKKKKEKKEKKAHAFDSNFFSHPQSRYCKIKYSGESHQIVHLATNQCMKFTTCKFHLTYKRNMYTKLRKYSLCHR